MSKTKEKELAIREETALVIPGAQATVELPDNFFDEEDFEGEQREAKPKLPYISIRQKDLKGDANINWERGWFKVQNTPAPADDIKPPLKLVVIFWDVARAYFRDDDLKPYCKSIDGKNGSLCNDETANGHCVNAQGEPLCQYAQWNHPNAKKDGKPRCAEGRILYCFSEIYGPCIIRLGRSGINPWDGFDNLMKGNRAKRPDGRVVRVPWHLNIIEIYLKKIDDHPVYDTYWIPDIRLIGIIKDEPTKQTMRDIKKEKQRYEETAQSTDFDVEDVNGSTFTDAQSDKQWAEKELDEAIKANNPKTNPDGSVADDDAFNTLI